MSQKPPPPPARSTGSPADAPVLIPIPREETPPRLWPDRPCGDYAVVAGAMVFPVRVYRDEDGRLMLRRRDLYRGRWSDDVFPVEGFIGVWAHFPDGTFGPGWET